MGNKKTLSIVLSLIVILLIALIVVVVYPRFKVPTYLKKGSFTTEIVERGEVVSFIEATGVVKSCN